MRMNRINLSSAALLAVAFVFLALVLAQAGKPYVLDEIDFPVAARATLESGLPIHYRGEHDTQALALWHPPLYIYLLAGYMGSFGDSESSVRAFGALCALLTTWLGIVLMRSLGEVRPVASVTFAALFLLNPYTLANATVPDIDTTILPITILLFILALTRVSRAISMRGIKHSELLGLALLFALALWSKLTTPFALIPLTALVVLVSTRSPWSAVRTTTLMAVGGGTIFLASYWLYCRLTGLPFPYVFDFLVYQFTKGMADPNASRLDSMVEKLSYVPHFLRWLTAPVVVLVAAGLASAATKLWRARLEPDQVRIAVLALFGLGVTAFYLVLHGHYGGFFKYAFPVIPLLLIPAAIHFADAIGGLAHLSRAWIGTLVLGAAAIVLVSIATASDVEFRTHAVMGATFWLAAVAIGLGLGLAVSAARTPNGGPARFGALAGTLVFSLALGIGIGVSRAQAIAPYPTKYEYGKTGLLETAWYVKYHTTDQEIIWTMKDVGHYSGRRFMENVSYITWDKSRLEDHLRETITGKGVRLFIVTEAIGQDRVDAYQDFRLALESCCDRIETIGNYVIYEAR
jgi:4-amino-4-deoxy-L-arabinose transferase-like glycosyltransferase